MIPVLLLIILTAAFVALIARDLLSAGRVPLLKPTSPLHIPDVTLTVIIPARNEARRISRCLDGLVMQGMSNLEIVVLDDDSTDGTADIAAAYRDRLPHLKVVAGQPLAAGWAGKCWACWQAAHVTDAQWLLFLDADTAPQPGMIQALLNHAVANRLDLVSLLPLLELRSFWERTIMPAFTGMIQAVLRIDRVNDPDSSEAFANGQCILVRRDVYLATDGHRAVQDSVIEDVRLAQTIKSAGYRIGVAGGPELLRVRMYTNLQEISEGLRKNVLAGMRATGMTRAIWAGMRQALLAFVPLLLLASGIILGWLGDARGTTLVLGGGSLYLLTLAYWGLLVVRLHRLSPVWAVLFPLGTAGYFALAGIAFWNIARGHGVTWKGRSYRK